MITKEEFIEVMIGLKYIKDDEKGDDEQLNELI